MYPVSKGWATYIGYALSLLTFLAAIIGKLAEDPRPLGLSPTLLVEIGVVLTIATTFGRHLQAWFGAVPVKWGFSSTISFIVMFLTGLSVVLADLVNRGILLGLNPGTMAKLTGAIATALILGRMLQSAFGQPIEQLPADPSAEIGAVLVKPESAIASGPLS